MDSDARGGFMLSQRKPMGPGTKGLMRRTPMNPGNGFGRPSKGFQLKTGSGDLSQEVGEGAGSSFGYSKQKQARGAALHDEVGEGFAGFGVSKKSQTAKLSKPGDLADEVGEGVAGSFGLSKASQTRNAGKFQDEVGEGITAVYDATEENARPFTALLNKAARIKQMDQRERKTTKPADPSKFKAGSAVESNLPSKAIPKEKADRNDGVMEMARGRNCLLMAPFTEQHSPDTTVCAHGNFSDMGKGALRKANDQYTVWACHGCHTWLDQGSGENAGTWEQKREVFLLGMIRQRLSWEQVAQDGSEPPKFRAAARWALERLEADEFVPEFELQELIAMESAQA